VNIKNSVVEFYTNLHTMPELGFEEIKTTAYIANMLHQFGYIVQTGKQATGAQTGVIGILRGAEPGPVLAIRADIDALPYVIEGKPCVIHACGHDANMSIVLALAKFAAEQKIKKGTLKLIFQPAEEVASKNGSGSQRMARAGAIDDVDILLGLHLRPLQEAGKGQASPALWHGAGYTIAADIKGKTAHGARPHLGINAIDGAAAAIMAVNSIRVDPGVSSSVKVTQISAAESAVNTVPNIAHIVFDLRAQTNEVMEELMNKTIQAIENGAATVGAKSNITLQEGFAGADYDAKLTKQMKDAIIEVLGEGGLLDPIVTTGVDDFHFYKQHKKSLKTAFMGLGCNMKEGLHNPQMSFDIESLADGVQIMNTMVNKILGFINK